MKIWIKGFLVGLISAVIWYASLFIRAFRPDPFGLALAPIASASALFALGIVLTCGWVCERWVFQRKTMLSAFVAFLFGFSVTAIISRVLESRWFGEGFALFGIYAAEISVPVLVFIAVSVLKKKPIQPPQTTTGSSAPDRV